MVHPPHISEVWASHWNDLLDRSLSRGSKKGVWEILKLGPLHKAFDSSPIKAIWSNRFFGFRLPQSIFGCQGPRLDRFYYNRLKKKSIFSNRFFSNAAPTGSSVLGGFRPPPLAPLWCWRVLRVHVARVVVLAIACTVRHLWAGGAYKTPKCGVDQTTRKKTRKKRLILIVFSSKIKRLCYFQNHFPRAPVRQFFRVRALSARLITKNPLATARKNRL